MRQKKSSSSNLLGLFYSYPVSLITQWCLVSKQTAAHYKTGRRIPSSRVIKLFKLHSQNKILGSTWRGWKVIDDKLVDPTGKELTVGQLNAYQLVWQLLAEKSKDDYYRLLEQASKSDINN